MSSGEYETAVGKALKYFNEGFLPFIKKCLVKKFGDLYQEVQTLEN
jgi:hypothetical protein